MERSRDELIRTVRNALAQSFCLADKKWRDDDLFKRAVAALDALESDHIPDPAPLRSLKLTFVGIFLFVVAFWCAVAWSAWSFIHHGAQQ